MADYGIGLDDLAAGGGAAAVGVNPWLAVGKMALDTIGGALGSGQEQEEARKARAMQWKQFLMQLQQRQSEQDDSRAQYGAHIAGAQAMNPLADRAFSSIQARLGLGPATLGQAGSQNRSLQAAAANYQPGQNPSMNRYSQDLEGLRGRFLNPAPRETPRMGAPTSGIGGSVGRRVDRGLADRYANDPAFADAMDRKRMQG